MIKFLEKRVGTLENEKAESKRNSSNNPWPIVIMCEILDNQTFTAKSADDCEQLAKKNNITFIEANTILDYYKTNFDNGPGETWTHDL